MDDSNRSNPQPVVSSSEAWHLAQLSAFESAAELVRKTNADLQAASLDEFCRLVVTALQDNASESWRTYLRHSNRTLAGSDRTKVIVTFSEDHAIPVVEWPESTPGARGMIDLPGGEGADMVLATPFRQVEISTLPPTRLCALLRDPRHAATAALVEVLQCAQRDAQSAFVAPSVRAGWRRLNNVIAVYRQAAKVSLEVLSDDDFIGWKARIPKEIEIYSAASLICEVAATARAQLAMAMYLMASWVQSLVDGMPANGSASAQEAFLARVSAAAMGLEKVLEGMNDSLAKTTWPNHVPGNHMIVFRPIPESLPMLVILPKGEGKATVAKLPKKKA